MAIRKLMLCLLLGGGLQAFAADKETPVDGTPGEREYREKSQKLVSLENKVGELEARFQDLIKAKDSVKGKSKKLELIEEMKTVMQERDETVEKFNKLRDEIRFKFPDKGKTVVRRYAPMQKKTFEQLEKRSTLDTDLSRAKKAADKVYRPFVQQAEEEERKKILEQEEAKKASADASQDPATKVPKIRLEK